MKFLSFLKRIPKKILIPIVVLVILAVIYSVSSVAAQVAWNLARGTVEIHVDGRDRLIEGDSYSYEVYTDSGRFINQNSWIRFKRNSGDMQNLLKPGSDFQCKTQGYRSKMLRKVPNLISCKEIRGEKG